MQIDIDQRSFKFSVRIVKLVNSLPTNLASKIVAGQLLRAGTSVGANIEEALGGHSKADFTHSTNIAKKEAREALYWLKLLYESNIYDSKELEQLIVEANELVAILTTIVRKSKYK